MNRVKIREMELKDFAKVHLIMQQIHSLHTDNIPNVYKDVDPLTFEEFNNQLNDENIFSYVAEIDGIVVGEIVAHMKETKNDRLMVKNKILHIDSVCVDEKYKKLGIGKLLFNKLEMFAKENKFDSIQLNVWSFNKDAIAFYEKNEMNPAFIRYEKIIK